MSPRLPPLPLPMLTMNTTGNSSPFAACTVIRLTASAIHFGNLRDPASKVNQIAAGERGYHALHALNTRPAITYLAKVRRGPVEG